MSNQYLETVRKWYINANTTTDTVKTQNSNVPNFKIECPNIYGYRK